MVTVIVLMLVVVLVARSCRETGAGDVTKDGVVVTRSEFDQAWPLTADKGILRCDQDAVTIQVSDKTYALNVEAQNRGLGAALGELWAANPERKGARMSTAGLIDKGLELCADGG